MAEVKLPELGENVEKGDVIRVLVNVGDVIKVDQPLSSSKQDKATIEVPSSIGGKVTEIKVKAGDKVKVGQVVLVLTDDAGAAKPASAEAAATEDKKARRTAGGRSRNQRPLSNRPR
jgi:pyruvate dehydrogenase E2 component (dihydrolipoamide acetyltransferase)